MAASTTLSPEQRRERARKAYLAGAVNTVCDRLSDLKPEQIEKLRAVLAP